MINSEQTLFKKLFKGSGWALFTMFVWELLEEALENIIAYALSSAVAIFVTKALSTLAIITATQGLKVCIKRFLFPFFKKLTYKDGNDKMKFLKNYFIRAWNNKITGTLAGLGFAGIVYFQTIINFGIYVWAAVPVAFVLFYNIGIFFGGEKLNQIIDRLKDATLKKEEKAKLKAIENKVKELAEKQKQALTEQAKVLVEQEQQNK